MIILDTDHLTAIQRQAEPAYTSLLARLRQGSEREVCTTIVNVEEQLRGWLVVIHRAKRIEQEIAAYQRLHKLFSFFGNIPVLDFDEQAAGQLTSLRSLRLRLGTMELKIAAVTLSRNALLLSRNLNDFRRVPALQVEDWIG